MEMEKKKKDYEAPDIEVTQIEVESSICNGSVEFTGETGVGKIDIASQGVQIEYNPDGSAINDFSNSSWDVSNSSL